MGEPMPEVGEAPPTDLYVGLSGDSVPVVTQVDAYYWRCVECGWLGTGLMSIDAAQREAMRHYRDHHGDQIVYVERKDVGR
jgi:hypothetical protein